MAIIVTGASRGIGLAVCEHLLASGANVVSVSRSVPPQLHALSDAPSESRGRIKIVVEDLSRRSSMAGVVESALQEFGAIHGIVHNAGVIEPIEPIERIDVDAVANLFQVNLFSVIELTKQCIPALRASRGRVIFVSSGASSRAYAGWSAYCASKAALNMFASSLAIEVPEIVSVAVRPGVVATDMQRMIREAGADGMRAEDHQRFVSMFEEDKLLNPSLPGTVIANLALHAPPSLSGKYISWDDPEIASLQKK